MLNEILDAVTARINEVFGDDYTIYTDAVEQGLQTPCFFVGFLEPSEKPMIGGRYFREAGIYIQFLPGEVDEPARERNRVADILMIAMEEIALDGGRRLNGTKRNCKTEGGVLSFFVNYNQFAVRERPAEPLMEDINVKGAIT